MDSFNDIPKTLHQRPDKKILRHFKRATLCSGKRYRNTSSRPSKEFSTKKKKRNLWVLKFSCARFKNSSRSFTSTGTETDIPECDSCVCTSYQRTEDSAVVIDEAFHSSEPALQSDTDDKSCVTGDEMTVASVESQTHTVVNPLINRPILYLEELAAEDFDEEARLERAREIAEGIEPPPGFRPLRCGHLTIDELVFLFQKHFGINSAAFSALSQLDINLSPVVRPAVHTQVDYMHCLVPDLLQITSCSYYWGKMDRYEAELLLDNLPDGTFLLRDSAQEEFLFSVSFRKYKRSLHARIEQWNHQFSFDSHDPGVFSSPTVCGLVEHYKDPACCMFFEPTLTTPLHRNFTFPLQHLCRAVICSKVTYDGISQLPLPKIIKAYLKEYHYKQKVKVRRLDWEQ